MLVICNQWFVASAENIYQTVSAVKTKGIAQHTPKQDNNYENLAEKKDLDTNQDKEMIERRMVSAAKREK